MAHSLSPSSSASFGLFITGLRFTHLCFLVALQWIFHKYSRGNNEIAVNGSRRCVYTPSLISVLLVTLLITNVTLWSRIHFVKNCIYLGKVFLCCWVFFPGAPCLTDVIVLHVYTSRAVRTNTVLYCRDAETLHWSKWQDILLISKGLWRKPGAETLHGLTVTLTGVCIEPCSRTDVLKGRITHVLPATFTDKTAGYNL